MHTVQCASQHELLIRVEPRQLICPTAIETTYVKAQVEQNAPEKDREYTNPPALFNIHRLCTRGNVMGVGEIDNSIQLNHHVTIENCERAREAFELPI